MKLNVSIAVQWNAVDDFLHTSYVVRWNSRKDQFQAASVVKQTSYTITGLTLDTVYTITVTPSNMCGDGPQFRTTVSLPTGTLAVLILLLLLVVILHMTFMMRRLLFECKVLILEYYL